MRRLTGCGAGGSGVVGADVVACAMMWMEVAAICVEFWLCAFWYNHRPSQSAPERSWRPSLGQRAKRDHGPDQTRPKIKQGFLEPPAVAGTSSPRSWLWLEIEVLNYRCKEPLAAIIQNLYFDSQAKRQRLLLLHQGAIHCLEWATRPNPTNQLKNKIFAVILLVLLFFFFARNAKN